MILISSSVLSFLLTFFVHICRYCYTAVVVYYICSSISNIRSSFIVKVYGVYSDLKVNKEGNPCATTRHKSHFQAFKTTTNISSFHPKIQISLKTGRFSISPLERKTHTQNTLLNIISFSFSPINRNMA